MPNIRSEITVGFELEIAVVSQACADIVRRNGWLTRHDASVTDEYGDALSNSREIISIPVPVPVAACQDGSGMVLDYGTMHAVIDDLSLCALEVNSSCGFHVHLGRPNGEIGQWQCQKSEWGPERTRVMLAIGLLLENQLYDLCPQSRRTSAYCRPITSVFNQEQLTAFYPVGAHVPDNKYACTQRRCWMNLVETRRTGTDDRLLRRESRGLGTIEIRMLGNVRRAAYLKAWARLWAKIAAYVAYVPSSLAVLHCASGSLSTELAEIAAAAKTPATQRATS